MKKIIIFIIPLLVIACQAGRTEDNTPANDTLTLRVAVMPTMSCLPVYYAQSVGLADSIWLEMSLQRYNALMDVDTAAINGVVDIFVSDSIRYNKMYRDIALKNIMFTPERLSLVAHGETRTEKIKDLKEKMVAITRHSQLNEWLTQLLQQSDMESTDVFRPQINDVLLRTSMLQNKLLDAAVLGEPFATWCVKSGHSRIAQSKDEMGVGLVWATTDSVWNIKEKQEQIHHFQTLYNMAVEMMNEGRYADTVRSILVREYMIPSAAADTLQLIHLKPATAL